MGISRNVLPESLIENAKQLEWLSRKLSQQYLYGKHDSRQIDTGLEFEQYRPYIQGDDLRQLDWKLYAKSSKYFIRQSPITAQNHLHQVVDNSASMNYREESYSKLELAKVLCAALSYISVYQGDTFSWEADPKVMQKSSGHKKWQISIIELFRISSLEQGMVNEHRIYRGKVIWFTDLYMNIDRIKTNLSLNGRKGTEFVLVNLIGKKEEELSFEKSTNFQDLETGERIDLNTESYRNTYKAKLSSHHRSIKDLCLTYRVPMIKVYIDNPVEQTLRTIIRQINILRG